MKKFLSLLLVLLWSAAAMASGQSQRTMLVISSYEEGEPWTNDLSNAVVMHMAAVDGVNCELVNLENALIKDSLTYMTVEDNLIRQYAKDKPEYVVMIGNFSFNLRRRVKREWGDVPMLLISRSTRSGALSDYFTSHTDLVPEAYGDPLEDMRTEYNFTAVVIPDFARETVDLMVRMNPKMKEFIFFTTNIFVQRRASAVIASHLSTHYPTIRYRQLIANAQNSEVIREYIAKRHADTGLLVGSWVFENESLRGVSAVTSNDLRLLSSSQNPFYTLREAYLSTGCIGGVFIDNAMAKGHIKAVINKMIAGEEMRKIPFYIEDKPQTVVYYPKLEEYGLSASDCPEDTIFIDKPQTFLEKYLWPLVTAVVIVVLVIVLMWLRMLSQRKDIRLLQTKETFLNNMPVPYAQSVIRADKWGNITTMGYEAMNKAYEELLARLSSASNPGRLFTTDFIQEKFNELMGEGRPVVFMYHFAEQDEFYDFTACLASTDVTEQGKVTHVDFFANNVTKRIKMEEEIISNADSLRAAMEELREQKAALETALRKANEADQLKSTFLASMSHEIRTPLNAIVGFSNLIADSTDDDRFARFKETINRNSELLLSLIGDVLDLAKIESNTIDLDRTPTDVNETISSALQTINFRLPKGVTARSVLPLPKCVIMTDPVRLSQVLINFLTNACKFTSQGSITAGYELRADNTLCFFVSDTGIGIDKEDLGRVFGQFVKLNNFAQGTGLGLAISKRLVELMGGEIGVASEGKGFGAKFWFTLPYQDAPLPQVSIPLFRGDDLSAESPADKGNENPLPLRGEAGRGLPDIPETPDIAVAPASGTKPLLLVAEDNESNYMLIKEILQDDYEIIHASHGGEAVALYINHTPDIILMDIGMPYVDGYEATRRIRAVSKDVPIIAVTAFAYASDKARILASGFNAYVSKPVKSKALLDALRRVREGAS